MEELNNYMILIPKVLISVAITLLFKWFWNFERERRKRLRDDYKFAEEFMAENRWKGMSGDSLERAYEALSGIRVEEFVVRFFLSQKRPLENLLDYATGKKFLVAESSGESVIIKLKKKFKWSQIKAWAMYIFFGALSIYPLTSLKRIILEPGPFGVSFWLLFMLGSVMLAYPNLWNILDLKAAKRIYNSVKMRPRREEILAYLKEKKDEFAQNSGIIKLGLFGSYALDKQTEESDIDLLIEFAPNTDALTEKKEAIKEAVQSAFGKKVDLCREKYIKPYFRQQILDSVIYV